jgi:hypothetical protein
LGARLDDLQDVSNQLETAVLLTDDLLTQPVVQDPASQDGVTGLTESTAITIQSLLSRLQTIAEEFLKPETRSLDATGKRRVLDGLIKRLKLGHALKNSSTNVQLLPNEEKTKIEKTQDMKPTKIEWGPKLDDVPCDERIYEKVRLGALKPLMKRIYDSGVHEANTLLSTVFSAAQLDPYEQFEIVEYLENKQRAKHATQKLKNKLDAASKLGVIPPPPDVYQLVDELPETLDEETVTKAIKDKTLETLIHQLNLLGLLYYSPRSFDPKDYKNGRGGYLQKEVTRRIEESERKKPFPR